MKRLFTLIVLLGLTAGVFTGCQPADTSKPDTTGTNAPAVTPPSTNAAK